MPTTRVWIPDLVQVRFIRQALHYQEVGTLHAVVAERCSSGIQKENQSNGYR